MCGSRASDAFLDDVGRWLSKARFQDRALVWHERGADFIADDLEQRNQMSAIAYLWTIEIEKHGAGRFRDKNESPYASRMKRAISLA